VTTNRRAVGIFGGSFDPIHAGHLALARAARDALHLDALLLVPAARPWQKSPITEPEHRAAMVELAIADEPALQIERCELERTGASYTIDTLRELRARYGTDTALVLVIGADQMERLDTWHEWRALLDHAHLGVARRNDAVLVLSRELQAYYNDHWVPAGEWRNQPAGNVIEVDMPPHDASATEVRGLLASPSGAGRDTRLAQIVPAPVLDYIRAHHLYT
jgi:nicotinate-nucleotide adenylyltransferase